VIRKGAPGDRPGVPQYGTLKLVQNNLEFSLSGLKMSVFNTNISSIREVRFDKSGHGGASVCWVLVRGLAVLSVWGIHRIQLHTARVLRMSILSSSPPFEHSDWTCAKARETTEGLPTFTTRNYVQASRVPFLKICYGPAATTVPPFLVLFGNLRPQSSLAFC